MCLSPRGLGVARDFIGFDQPFFFGDVGMVIVVVRGSGSSKMRAVWATEGGMVRC